MAWSFGDSFDLYAVAGDMANGYWDSLGSTPIFAAGRFTGSQALSLSGNGQLITKSSAVNDAVHHLVVAFKQTAAITGAVLGAYFELFDGVTAQCSIVFRSDGAILLTSGIPTGTVLATYTGAVTTTNTWYAFEFEVVINNATGSFAVRKNGNNVADFTATSLDTQNSANAYANKLTAGMNVAVNSQLFDDLFWQSGAATGSWLGDIRCYARMPASDQSVTFSRTSTGVLTQTVPTSAPSTSLATSLAKYTAFTAAYSGIVTGTAVAVNGIGTSVNMKCAIFADNAGTPGAILASATAPVNPVVAGTNAFTFSGVTIAKGVNYWIGVTTDGSVTYTATSVVALTGASGSSSYAAFPQNNPVVSTNQTTMQMSWTYTSTPANWQAVSEPQEDGLTSYVYDSNPGDADFYGVAAIGSTPATVIGTVVRGYMQKSDAGTRTAAVQLKSSSVSGYTTWSATDKTAGVTLSNGNLTAATSGGSNNGVRGAAGWSTGKYYFEATMGWLVSSDYIGVATSAAALNNSASLNTCVLSQSGTVLLNNVSVNGSFGSRSAGDVIGIAVDLVNSLIWFRVAPSGNWNASGTANPATGVGGVNFAAIGNPTVYPYAFFVSFAYSYIANFGATSFTGAVPSGFTSGWPGLTSTTVAAPTLTLTTSGWQWAWRMDLTDPNTGAAWTAAAVNSVQVGPKVIA